MGPLMEWTFTNLQKQLYAVRMAANAKNAPERKPDNVKRSASHSPHSGIKFGAWIDAK